MVNLVRVVVRAKTMVEVEVEASEVCVVGRLVAVVCRY
jgi:hypothetical protein